MNKCCVKRTCLRRGMICKQGNVGIKEKDNENPEEDRGCQKALEDLSRHINLFKVIKKKGPTQAIAHAAMTQFEKTSERPTSLTSVFYTR